MYQSHKLTPQQKAELVEERSKKGYPPHSPPYPLTNQEYYLLTAAYYQHQKPFNVDNRRQQILNQLFEIFLNEGREVRGWVILPNPYYL
ncbi:MAG: transposase, partial [Moorea sp. SIO2B7]|nr:transposase [Moorena sp. SIO2B7]